MDNVKKDIKDEIDSMTVEQAREAVAMKYGTKYSEYHDFAEDCLAAKESALRDARDSENLTISRNALQAAEEANRLALGANSIASKARSDARCANIIAITAAIIAIAAIIVQWLTKN